MQVKSTMASKAIMCSGRISVTLIICLAPFFSNSMGAKILGFPVSLRMRLARALRIAGAYVSGRKDRTMSEAPAMIKATQKVQRQLTTDTKPEIIGAS